MQLQINWTTHLSTTKLDDRQQIIENAPKVLETPQGIISMVENSTAFGPIKDPFVTDFFIKCINFNNIDFTYFTGFKLKFNIT